jgi:hypothetical protein
MEEAKRKLDANRSSKAYYHNLNNKLKSSVANVMRATQDLGRSAEARGKTNNRSRHGKDAPSSDDIDSVYMPWMMENYGRKLAIEALKRRGNMNTQNQIDPLTSKVFESRRRQNQLHSQYHLRSAKSRDG